MKSIPQQIAELRTAAIASKRITATQIIEAMKGTTSDEQRLSKLVELATPHNITVPVPESYSDKIANLTEKIVASGKLTAVEINESIADCLNEKERFDTLQSISIAKRIGMKPVERKNFGAQVNESDANPAQLSRDERIIRTSDEMNLSIRESAVFLGFPDPGLDSKLADSAMTALAARWKKYNYLLSEADCRQLAEKGIVP